MSAHLRLLGLLACVLLCACPPTTDPSVSSEEPTEQLVTVAAMRTALETNPDLQRAPLSAIELRPALRTVGRSGAIPDRIVVQFAIRVVTPDVVGSLSEGTKLTLDPPIPGTLVFDSESSLSFVPDRPFEPSTRYRVHLQTVGTRDGILGGGTGVSWRHEFRTPSFRATGLTLKAAELELHSAELELAFTGPVTLEEISRQATVQIEGRRPASFEWDTTDRPGVLSLSVTDPGLVHGSVVHVSANRGLALEGHGDDHVLGRLRMQVDILAEDLVSIVGLRRREGPTGFFVEVVCDDTSVESRRRWWHDEVISDWRKLSARCIPDEAATEFVRIEPELPFTISPSRHGFRVLADFERGSYTVTIDAGLRTEDGGGLASPFSTGVTIPARTPTVAFTSKGRYLPRSSWRNLGVRHLNVSEVKVEVRHVPRENLVFWLSGDDERVDERTSNRIAEQRVAISGPVDEHATTWIDVGGMVPTAGNGIYEVRIAADGSNDVARLLVTDINLVTKRGAPEVADSPETAPLWVWAVDMHDNKPRSGVRIDLVRKSGKVLSSCSTDRQGGCSLAPRADSLDESAPFAIVASSGADLTYLRFADLKIDHSDDATEGESYRAERPYRLAPWSDRGVYRPGDTAHLAGLLRGRDHVAPSEAVPVELSITDPNGNTLGRHRLETNAAGLVSHDLPFADFATTGRWTATFKVADEVVARHSLSVEEFVPERMRVSASAVERDVLAGAPIAVDVDAAYLFGGSASGSAVELSCQLQPTAFVPSNHSEFTYGLWHGEEGPPSSLSLGAAVGSIDPDGTTRVSCPGLDGGASFQGGGRVIARAAVFEAGSGRTTQATTTALVHPERFAIGLQSGEQEVRVGQPFEVTGVVVDWDGETVGEVGKVEVALFRLVEEYGLMYDRRSGRERWRRYLRKVADGTLVAEVEDGRFAIGVTPTADSAGYLVSVRQGGAATDLRLDGQGRRYWWWDNEDTVDETPRPLRPGSLAVVAPPTLDIGQRADVSFVAPHAGRALVTVETDRVLRAEWVEVDRAGPVTWSFVPETFVPNVYVSVLLLKDPHLETDASFLPARSFGVTSAAVRPERFVREVKLDVPEEITPNSTLTVGVDAGRTDSPAWVTVAVVDEGILQLTHFDSPDPLARIFSPRALGIESYETVGWTLLVPPQGASSSDGGGSASALGRIQMVKPVALWSGLVELDKRGRAVVDMEIPQYRGALRVMAVVAGAKRVGSADAEVIVRDPLVLQATTPRFLTGGDRFELPVFVTNTTKEARTIEVALRSSELVVGGDLSPGPTAPPVAISGSDVQTVRLEPGESGRVLFEATAVRSVGAARLRVEASSGDLQSWDQLDVPLSPALPGERIVRRVELSEGTVDLAPYLAGWMPTTERSNLWVSSNPFGDVFGHLTFLVRYPYGCIEQTTSSTRPLLYVRRLLGQVDPTLVADASVDEMVDFGLERVLSMQTAGGGLAYWPGGSSPTAWATSYGVHLLLDAKEAGYDVPEDSLDRALDWLESTSGNSDYQYARPYGEYVLAKAGRGHRARIAELIAARERRTGNGVVDEELYLLQAALYLAGDRKYEDALRAPDISVVSDDRRNDWSFYSDRRRRALMLNVMMDVFGTGAETEALADAVATSLRGHGSGWYTTQELAWGVAGLGRWVEGGSDGFSVPQLRLNGQTVAATSAPDGSSERSWAITRASEYPDVELSMESLGEGRVYLTLTSEGIRTDATPKVGGAGLKLTRTHQRADGTVLAVGDSPGVTPELGDLVYTVVHLTNQTGHRVPNIALTDRLAAGWEIENPRLGRGSGTPDWLRTGTRWSVDHMNVRDDRVEVFGSVGPGETVTFSYAARAVTAGDFTVPPASAEAMYDPRLWATTPSGTVSVLGPWTGLVSAD